MDSFVKYASIENSYREKTIEHIRNHYHGVSVKWVVTEKIHGTNLSILYDATDKSVKIAKRTGVLGDDASRKGFYRSDLALSRAEEAADAVFEWMKHMSVQTLQVYGEWAGGGSDGTTKIQSGIFYSSTPEFFVFDMREGLINEDDKYVSAFIPPISARRICEKVGLTPVPLIGVCDTLDDALAVDTKFNSMIPKEVLKEEENLVEGVVIEPENPSFLPNGNRVILKKKNEKWMEKSGKRKRLKTPISVSKEANVAMDFVSLLITEPRLEAVVSKIGPDEKPHQYIGAFAKDVLEDLEKDLNDDSVVLTDDDWKYVKKAVAKASAPFVMRRV